MDQKILAIGQLHLGRMHSDSFRADPKHIAFVLARYKFVAKMLAGLDHVLEVGCGDGTGAQLVKQTVGHLVGIDCDPKSVGEKWDIRDGPFPMESLDAVYALDMIEHISPAQEDWVLLNMRRHLKPYGTMIIGMPSAESQPYASHLSRMHHVNCKTEDELRETMRRHFHAVYLFGMNDETLHTGFGPMCHYRLALAVGPRNPP